MITQEMINRINELSKKKKSVGLTEEEQAVFTAQLALIPCAFPHSSCPRSPDADAYR